MKNERNNILEDFKYGFCNLLGESLDTIEMKIQLGWNEEAISLLTEIYPIVGKMNLDLAEDKKNTIIIDEYDLVHDELFDGSMDSRWQKQYGEYFLDSGNNNEVRKVRIMKVLKELSDYNDIVVGLRELLYSEIELSNYKMFNEVYVERDEIASTVLLKLGLQLTKFFDKSFEEKELHKFNNFVIKGRFLNLNYSFRMQELVDFIENIIENFGLSYIRFEKIIECLEVIKNSGLVANADRLWNIFLLKLYSIILFDKELVEFQEIEIDVLVNDDRYKSIIRDSYSKIDERLKKLQYSNIQNMLVLYSMERVSSRAFCNHDVIRQLYNALNSSKDLRERYLIKSTGKHSKCFAAMYNRNKKKKYAALSGVFNSDEYIYPGKTTEEEKNKSLKRKKEYNKLVSLLKNILGSSYEVIDSDCNVEYYYKKNGKMKSVTAQKFISYPYPIDKRLGNRMFSCCERKLSTKLVLGCEHDFYIKYAPCTLCNRMINEKTKNNAYFINVFYMRKIKDLAKDILVEFDKLADEVK